jgi:hypothetical protein
MTRTLHFERGEGIPVDNGFCTNADRPQTGENWFLDLVTGHLL